MRCIRKYLFLLLVAFFFLALFPSSVHAKENLTCMYTLSDGETVEWVIGQRPTLSISSINDSSIKKATPYFDTLANFPSSDGTRFLGDNDYDECPELFYYFIEYVRMDSTVDREYVIASKGQEENLKSNQTFIQSSIGLMHSSFLQMGYIGATVAGVVSVEPQMDICFEFEGSQDQKNLENYQEEIDAALEQLLKCTSANECSLDVLNQYVDDYEKKSISAKNLADDLSEKYHDCQNILVMFEKIGVTADGVSYEDKINELRQTYLERSDLNSDEREQVNDLLQKAVDSTFNYKDYAHNFGSEVEVSCEGILGLDLINAIQEIFDWLGIIAPILLIVFGSMDFGKAVLINDNDALKKAASNFLKRCIAAILLFLLPFMIQWLFTILAENTDIIITNPLCNIK